MVRVLEVIGKRPQGGIGSFITNYQIHFKEKDVKLDYLIFNDEPTGVFDDKVRAMGSDIFVLPELKNSRLISIWKSINAFFDENGKKYDAVHLHSVNIAFMVFPAAKRNGVEYLLSHSHATVYSDKKINSLRNYFLCKGLKKQATHYLACSVAAGDFLYGKKNRNKVSVFNNAIDCNEYAFQKEIREKYRKSLYVEDCFVIGHVGRFNEQKNHKYLVKIFEKLVLVKENAKLILVGDGPLRENIEQEIEERGLEDKVLFLGQRCDVNKLMMAMDLFILPSLYEGLPVVGIEAQASGLPCIMSDAITEEVALVDTYFESIKADSKVWVDKIVNIKINDNTKRENAHTIIAAKGYDINQEANKLYEFYKGLERKR